jgi:aminoglycoside 3-N-acetyltransferase I
MILLLVMGHGPGAGPEPGRIAGEVYTSMDLDGAMSERGSLSLVRIERITEAASVRAADHLFDEPSDAAATEAFLASPTHHLLVAHDETGRPIGLISGVETTHPDKGTEMFLYELAVDEASRRQGVATRLIEALGELARARGCHGMWVAVDPDNAPALATYRRARPAAEEPAVIFSWTFD